MDNKNSPPLQGIKVLDLSRVLAGPLATQILADLGANIIKVERPDGGDETRSWGPPFCDKLKTSAYYLAANRGKKSILADFNNPIDVDRLKNLASRCDVVVENFPPGKLIKYGLDRDSLTRINPRLIYCSITGFGQEGPWSQLPGFDAMIQAVSGLMSVTGYEKKPPLRVGIPVADILTGLYAVIAILTGLIARQTSAIGTKIDLSLYEVMLASLYNQGQNYLVSGVPPKRTGDLHPTIVPYQRFATKDGDIVIAAGNNRQFEMLCNVLNVAHLGSHIHFNTNALRCKNRDLLIPILSGKICEYGSSELIYLLQKEMIPCGAINDVKKAVETPQAIARKVVQTFENKVGYSGSFISGPLRFNDHHFVNKNLPPMLGQQNSLTDDELLEEF